VAKNKATDSQIVFPTSLLFSTETETYLFLSNKILAHV